VRAQQVSPVPGELVAIEIKDVSAADTFNIPSTWKQPVSRPRSH
jgi:hypothetical protein